MKKIALALLAVLLLAATLALALAKTTYATQDRDHIAESSTSHHRLGTDDLGRDRAIRLAGALLLGLAGAASASALSTLLAVSVGTAAAFSHRLVAAALLYLADLFLILPWLFLLMILRSALPLTLAPATSAILTFLLLGLLGWAAYARVTFAGAQSIRNADWLLYARALGLRKRHLALRHILPNLLPLALSQFLILIPIFLIAETNLGTLGLGIPEPLPSYGSMLLALQHASVLASSPLAFAPILLLILVLTTLELLVTEP